MSDRAPFFRIQLLENCAVTTYILSISLSFSLNVYVLIDNFVHVQKKNS